MAKRVGRFEVSEKLIWDIINGKGNTQLFEGMIPVDVKRDMMRSKVEYICSGPMFDEVPEGQIIPMYRPVFDDGKSVPRWELVE